MTGSSLPSPFTAADAYEHFMGRWSRRLAPLFVEFAGVIAGDTVLDVGAGTGALATAAASVASVEVVGVDRSFDYVRAARASLGRGRFHVGDARALALADRRFTRALSLFTMNFLPDAPAAVREMVRATRPRGVVAAAVWDYGRAMTMLRAFWDEAAAVKAAAKAHDERHMPLCRPGELEALWRQSGLEHVTHEPIDIDLPFASFDDYWAPFLGGQGPAGAYVTTLDDADRIVLEARLRRRLLGGRPDGPFSLHARAWAVRGVVPER
ncbi:MAG: class I SAM-dependent methyltransferase [Vicinamibacterales bacterium]